MRYMSIPYKSFCWNIGTTSFRTKDFNRTIEQQLALLDEFWQKRENVGAAWEIHTQECYYNFLREKNFVYGDAANKAKDAREKTSGLVDIGLVDANRRLTDVGTKLLKMTRTNDFAADNGLQIPKDSFLYLKQLLKFSKSVGNDCVRPLIVLIYVLSKTDYLTRDEFTFLLPLCTNSNYTRRIIKDILDYRQGKKTIDEIIVKRLMTMSNYQEALDLWLKNPISEELVLQIGFNRKSRKYDKPYVPLYQALKDWYVDHNHQSLYSIYAATLKINIGVWWRSFLFTKKPPNATIVNPVDYLNPTILDKVKDERELKIAFFKLMHTFKAKSMLADYYDLNARYIKTSDIFLFEDDMIRPDIVPKYFFFSVVDKLYKDAYKATSNLAIDCPMEDINSCLVMNDDIIIASVNAELGTSIYTLNDAKSILEGSRYKRLARLIENKFGNENILLLLSYFETRNDTAIREMVTDNADIPTIFEYVLGIAWYKISEGCGKILDYMKLSLDADLLPKTHAAGGEADIVYEYKSTDSYPKHTLLLEATLAGGTNQRRMEMEPVSRHLGNYLLRKDSKDSYAVFVTTFLDLNVIADFKVRKHMFFYDVDEPNKYIVGMKIIPLSTVDLKHIIQRGIPYRDLYKHFETAYASDLAPHLWYERCINRRLDAG